jgi:biopolymer transport protein ExbB/TolQ
VAKDLGTWPPEQATVLVQVLQRANLTPDARRTREGIVVTVPDEQADVAVRALAENMDAIADAARSRSEARRRREREQRAGRSASSGDTGPGLTSERMLKMARPLALVMVALLVLSSVARINPLLGLLGVGVGLYLLGRRVQDGGDGRPGGRGPRAPLR